MNRWLHKQKPERSEDTTTHGKYVLLAITLASMAGVFVVLFPHLHSIILALLLTSLFRPAHQWFLKMVEHRKNLAAFLSVMLAFLVVIAPITFLANGLLRQGRNTLPKINSWISQGHYRETLESSKVVTFCRDALDSPRLEAALDHLGIGTPDEPETTEPGTMEQSEEPPAPKGKDSGISGLVDTESLIRVLRDFSGIAGKTAKDTAGAIVKLFMGFVIMLFVMFFSFRDGKKMLKHLLHLSPLSATQENAFVERIAEVTRAVVLGIFITAAAQALVAMIGFKLVGIPAIFWGTLLGLASLVPMVGTALVWVPAVGYLFMVEGQPFLALFLALWCLILVGSIDNFLRPILMGGKVGMSTVVIFLAILGGLRCFGPLGILYGPLIFGLCSACFQIYESEHAAFLARQDQA